MKLPKHRRLPVLMACLVAALTFRSVQRREYRQEWTVLQRYYLGAFVRSGLLAPLKGTGDYNFIDVIDRKGPRPALNFEVVAGTTDDAYALSADGAAHGDKRLEWRTRQMSHAGMHQILQRWIYDGRSLWDLVKRACAWSLGVLVLGLLAVLFLERERRPERQLTRSATGSPFPQMLNHVPRRRERESAPPESRQEAQQPFFE
jgi:hypothetical protein